MTSCETNINARSLLDLLRKMQWTIATAESCTGGLLAAALVDVPGASECFECGWITYSNASKQNCLGVENSLLEQHGAVSMQIAQAMADGCARLSGCNIGISTTGIAGPSHSLKPVGLVFIGIALYAHKKRLSVHHKRLDLEHERPQVQGHKRHPGLHSDDLRSYIRQQTVIIAIHFLYTILRQHHTI